MPIKERRHVRLFRTGRHQAVRIPRDLELDSDEVTIRREGSRLIIEPIPKPSLLSVLKSLAPIDEDFPDVERDLPELDRPKL
ncbi:MAG: AbrB/MazE/SpoVT family DNA-binding domain-containing protein [Myxococcota bacterium]